MYILHIVDVWFKQNYTIVIGQHWTNGLTLQVRYFWITIRFPNEKIYRWKLMWADFDIELPWLDSNYFDNLNDKSKHLVFFYLVTFCSCLLTSWEFLLRKKFSDMVHRFQWDQREKMKSEIIVNLFLHHVGIYGPCQTLSIFSICFLSLF